MATEVYNKALPSLKLGENFMIYAKCIHSDQVVENVNEFIKRQNEDKHVYCEGQTTMSKNGMDVLDCVPLNFVFDCLKYGKCIAIIDIKNDEDYHDGVCLKEAISSSKQHVLKIMDADSKESIDYIFEHVKNKEIIHRGYLHYLSKEMQDYFNEKMQG